MVFVGSGAAVIKSTASAASPMPKIVKQKMKITKKHMFSTRIKDAGIAIRHSRGRILFYTAGSRNGVERVAGHGPGHKKEVDPEKKHTFLL